MTSPAPADAAAAGPVETRSADDAEAAAVDAEVAAADAEAAAQDAKTLAEDDI